MIAAAARRRVPTTFVLNRLPEAPERQQALLADFAARLAAEGHVARSSGEHVLGIAEGPTGPEGLAAEAVAGVRKELEALGGAENRMRVVRSVTGAGLSRLHHGLDALRSAVVDAAVVRNELLDPVRAIYAEEIDDLATAVMAGGLGDIVGDPDAVAADLAAVVTHRAGRAARRAAEAWDGHPVGSRLLEATPGLWSHGVAVVTDARERCAAWRSGLDALVAPAAGRLLRSARVRVMGDALAARALDPQRSAAGRRARRLTRIPGAVAEARSRLVAALRDILEIDAGRFMTAVGAGPQPGVLGVLTLDGEGGR
jgi:hypothetical protein